MQIAGNNLYPTLQDACMYHFAMLIFHTLQLMTAILLFEYIKDKSRGTYKECPVIPSLQVWTNNNSSCFENVILQMKEKATRNTDILDRKK